MQPTTITPQSAANPSPQTSGPVDVSPPTDGRRPHLTIVLATLVVVLVVAAWFYHSPKASSPTPLNSAVPALADQDDSNYQHEATVELGNGAFLPSTLDVKLHTRVYFQNTGSQDITIQANDQYSTDAAFAQSETVLAGSGYAYNFQHAGTYLYHDVSNPSVNGSIVVENN